MLRSIYNSWSGINACERSLAQVSHNLANVSTTAYKRSELAFSDMLYRTLQERRLPSYSAEGLAVGQGTGLRAQASFSGQGTLRETERPFDLAISGEGYFRFFTADGETVYSRDGHLILDAAGRLVNSAGDYLDFPFMPGERGSTLSISPEGAAVITGSSGEPVERGQIRLYRFSNPAGLANEGGGRYLESAFSGPPLEGLPGDAGFGRIQQYYLEQSNTDTALEMVQLLLDQRALQSNVRSLLTADELQALALQIRL